MKTSKFIIIGLGAGLISSWLKALVEPPLEKMGQKLFPPTEAEKNLKGADLLNHPENMPPAILLQNISSNLYQKKINEKKAVKLMPYIHYSLGTGLAFAYLYAREENKKFAFWCGFPAGATMFAATHGSVIPFLKLQAPLYKMPKSWWVWEFGSHLLFGFFLEKSITTLKKII